MSIYSGSIIDSHQHFWQMIRGDYDWLTPDLTILYRDFLPADYRTLAEELGIVQSILVQAAATEEETIYLLDLAEENDFIAGVVGWVDMEKPSSSVTKRLEEFSNNPFFKGIRPMLQDIEDIDWILNPSFSPVFEQLVKLDLTFDALVHLEHLENIFYIASRYPKLRVVIDHCAKPNIANQKFDIWAEKLKMFAKTENVYIKISGLTTEANANQTSADNYKRYVEHVRDVFGSERIMWGSDWPVVNLKCAMSQWIHLTNELVADWSPEEIENIFVNSARTFYKINNIKSK